MTRYTHSARQATAARTNLAKARAAEARRPRTAKQLAASRSNLRSAHRGPETPAQHQAALNNLAKARQAHHPRTAKQLAAAKANLAHARKAAANHQLTRQHSLKHTLRHSPHLTRHQLLALTPAQRIRDQRLTNELWLKAHGFYRVSQPATRFARSTSR